jgi:hypothetical protein
VEVGIFIQMLMIMEIVKMNAAFQNIILAMKIKEYVFLENVKIELQQDLMEIISYVDIHVFMIQQKMDKQKINVSQYVVNDILI